MKARGWFHFAVVFLAFGFSSQLVALSLDFEKEIKKREVVTVRVVERIKAPKASVEDVDCQKADGLAASAETSENTFNVCLSSIRH